jgi:hypothetical protein
MTDAHPFKPHAHGTNAGASRASRDSPRGNGSPIAKASGAIVGNAASARAHAGHAAVTDSATPKLATCQASPMPMAATAMRALRAMDIGCASQRCA